MLPGAKLRKIKKYFFIPFFENCSDKSASTLLFLVLYCDLPKRGVLAVVLNLFVEMPKAVRGFYEFACIKGSGSVIFVLF